MPFKIEELIADPSFAPRDWQSAAPRDVYTRAAVSNSADLERVLALPRRALELDGTDRAETIIDMMTERYSLGNTSCQCAQIDPDRYAVEGCINRLRLLQALALREIGICGGLLAPIGVGHGKTLLDLLAPFAFQHHARAHGMPGADELLCVLLVPPGLVVQLAADYAYIGQHFKMPSMIVQGAPDLDRMVEGAPRLQVMPYSRIQRGEATSWLNVVKPHAIIADECHKLRNMKTATGARVVRYVDDHPDTRMAAWSGSMTSKSVKDYAHIARMCLKRGSPLPLDYEVVEDWARAIDPCNIVVADPGPLLRGLIDTQCCAPGENLYTGIGRRISETLGVVSSTTPSVDCDLELLERKIVQVPQHIKALIDGALAFERPDGEELVTAMQTVACALEIASGFHYRWIFPHNVFPRDTALVEDWRGKRKEWFKELRTKLKSRDEHLDSPQLCEYAAQRALGLRPAHKGLPTWASKTYRAWYDVKPMVKPESDAVRIDKYLAQDAANWAVEHRGIVWYQHAAFGEWVAELSGLPMFGGGKPAKLALLGSAKLGIKGEQGTRSVICSLRAHGTGTNGLQYYFSEQLFGSNPADPAGWEQPLGRLHRIGQRAKCVKAYFYLHTKEMRKHVMQALHAAVYVEGTMRDSQRLRTAFPLGVEESLQDEE